MKYTCPKCQSNNVGYWEQSIIEKRFDFKKDCSPKQNPISKFEIGEYQDGLFCKDCNNYVNENDITEYKKWKSI